MRAILSPEDVPFSQPATELLAGVLVQKMSPRRTHFFLQKRLCALLDAWGEESGKNTSGSELDVDITVGAEPPERFVPDAAFIEEDGSVRWSESGVLVSPVTVAFEIASPGDTWRKRTSYKIERYLASGAAAVVAIDPATRSITIHTASGHSTLVNGDDIFDIAPMSGFHFTLDRLFSVLDRS